METNMHIESNNIFHLYNIDIIYHLKSCLVCISAIMVFRETYIVNQPPDNIKYWLKMKFDKSITFSLSFSSQSNANNYDKTNIDVIYH